MQWQSMPYEIASALVRTLAIHCAAMSSARSTLSDCEGKDPGLVKVGSMKAKDAYEALWNCTRHIVMNKRTSQIATQDFVAKHIKVDENGLPTLKKEGTKIQPWIMSVSIVQHGVHAEADLALRLRNSEPFRKVRCIDLANGAPRAKITVLMESYLAMNDENFDQESDGAESEATQIGDEDGLEGLSSNGY